MEQLKLFEFTNQNKTFVLQSKLFEMADPELVERWWRWNTLNPHIYNSFRRIAHDLKDRGFKKGSGWFIVQHIRWMEYEKTKGESAFKISNDFISLLTRLLIYEEGEFATFFTIKKMKRKRVPVVNVEDALEVIRDLN